MRVWLTDEPLTITVGEETLPGLVTLASKNGKSLVLGFDGLLAGHVGVMPVLMGADGVFRSLIGEHEVTLSEREGGDQAG